MKFAIRDDDTNYFTKPEELISNYSHVWDTCPISLSVVPFHTCTKTGAIPKAYWTGNDVYPIRDNQALVKFLLEMMENGRISIMLHGYSHKDNPDGYEFDTGDNLYEKVKKGRDNLKEVFNTEIKVFVPPHNTLSKKGLAAVINNNLNLVNTPSFRIERRAFQLGNVLPFIKQKCFKLRFKNKYPYVLSFPDHKEVAYYSLTPEASFDDLKESFDFCREKNGSYILATHYWEFAAVQSYNRNITMGDVFNQFWEYVIKFNDVQFVSVNGIFES